MAENPIPEKETKEPLLPGPKPSEGGVALESKSIPNFETSFGETGKVAQAQQGDAISGNKIQNHGFSAAEVQQIVSSKDQQHAEETRHWREMVERLLRPGQSAKKRVAREGYRRPAAGASARADAKPPEILTIESAVAFIASEQPALGVDDFTVVLECILRAERGPPVSPTPPVPPAPPEPVVLALKKKSQAPPPAAPLPSILDQWRADRMRFMDSTGAILKRGANDRMVVGFESETRRDETLASLGTRVIWLGEEVPGRLLADGLLSHESSGVRAFTLERALEIAIADPGETGGRFVRRVGALLTESIGEKSECAGWYFGMLQAMWAAPVLQPHIVALLKSFVEGGKWQTVFSLAKACSKIAFATRAEPLFDLLEQTTMPEDSKEPLLETQLEVFGFLWDACLDVASPDAGEWWRTTLRRANAAKISSILRLLAGSIAASAQFHPFARNYAFNIALFEHANRGQYRWLRLGGLALPLRILAEEAVDDLKYTRLENRVLAWVLDGYNEPPGKHTETLLELLATEPLDWLVTGGEAGIERLPFGVYLLVDWAAGQGVGRKVMQVPDKMAAMLRSLAVLSGAPALRTALQELHKELDRQIHAVQHDSMLTFSTTPWWSLAAMTTAGRRHLALLLAARRDACRLLYGSVPRTT